MKTQDEYLTFLRSKIPQAELCGFEPPSPSHPSLFPHQRDVCEWAIRGGRRALFEAFGMGKSRQNIQLAIWVTEQTGGKYLIVAPLGVRQEFTQSDGPAMGVDIQYVRTDAEVEAATSRILITNYERVRDGGINVNQFSGVGLDEAAVLRSFGSKTYQEFLPLFKTVPYRFVFTATPSPNRYKELIHYAGFLGVMDTGEALTRFFQRDSSQAGNLTLYPHMEAQFWMWLTSWAVFLQKPSDLGYSDEGYDMPDINVHWHCLPVDHHKAWNQVDSWGQAQLLQDEVQGLAAGAEIKRDSIEARVNAAVDIVGTAPERHWLIWHDLEDERRAIEKRFPKDELKSVYGSQDLEIRESAVMGFARGEYRILATKPSLCGSGCNFQRHCSDAVFMGIGYKFADFIQAIHRIQRFQQKRPVQIHIVYLESEAAIRDALETKWRQHNELMARMAAILREHKLAIQTNMHFIRSLHDSRALIKSDRFLCIWNDCVMEMHNTPENSFDAIVTSIPFGNQYEYSPSYNDFGHNAGDDPFFEQMGHLCPQLLRTLRPGRIAAIHVKDRILFGNVTGDACPTVNPFSDKTVKAFTDAGFLFMARITIDTDVVRENAQTYRLGWSENAKDSSKMGAGMPEYVLIFRKRQTDMSKGYADVPVTKSKEDYTRADWQLDAAGLWRSDGDRLPDPEIMKHMPMEAIKQLWIRHSLKCGYSHEEHARICRALEEQGKLPSGFMLFPAISRNADIWTDISRMRTLNSEQSRRKQEMHVCPLQLDIIKRLITRYTMPGETVYDPFGGIGSVPYQALMMGRNAVMTELNRDYWKAAVGYCERAEATAGAPTLFDMMMAATPEAAA